MKKIGTLLLGLLLGANAIAQTCTVDPSFTEIGAHPSVLEIGTVGTTYEQDVTVIFPSDTIGYPIVQAIITNVNLPAGLSWDCNTSDCTYNPSVNPAGCFRIYGTPESMGTFNISIEVDLSIELFGGMINTYTTTLEISAASNGLTNEGFNTSSGAGCAPLTVSFTNNNPGMDGYQWSFGNGHNHWGETPENVVYEEPGEYLVNYTAYGNADTTYTYVLNSINLTYVEQSLWYVWLFDMNPKFYIEIFESGQTNYVYRSSNPADSPNGHAPKAFNGINLPIDPTKTYTVKVWEYDLADADDACGTHVIAAPFTNDSSAIANTSTINWTITTTQHLPSPDMQVVDTIRVYGPIAVPEVEYTNGQLVAIAADAVTYQWKKDGVSIENATESTYTPTESGYYTVVVANAGGCEEVAIEVLVSICLNDYTPSLEFAENTTLEYTNPVAGHSVQWLVNNVVVEGAEGTTMPITQSGAYTIIVSDQYGCSYTSEAYNAFLSVNELAANSVIAFPNPTTGKLNISAQSTIKTIDVLDATGRVVIANTANDNTTAIDLSTLPNGYYIVKIQTVDGFINKNVVKH